MTPQHVYRVYGERRIDRIARVGTTGVGRSSSEFGSCYLQPGEFERLKAEGVAVITMAEVKRMEDEDRYGKISQLALF